ncbi:MAG TPA: DUF4173 domain-containing protein [Leptospiraceae bacterium]|nr:DUF4173 domain-containing protein [Leptospiraceae bacterium]
MENQMTFARRSAWFLGIVSVFCAGLFQIPVNLQGTLVYSATLVVFWWRIRHSKVRSFWQHPLIAVVGGFILAGFLTFTTNGLLVTALHLSIFYLLGDLLLRQFGEGPPESISDYCGRAAKLILLSLKRFFSRSGVVEFSSLKTLREDGTRGRLPLVLFSVLLGFVIFFLLHYLFAAVNDDYRRFMDPLVRWVWSACLKNLCLSLIHAYILFCIFTVERSENKKEERALPIFTAVAITVGAVIVTGVFAFFQTRVVLSSSDLNFHELSKYTQKGFLQLIFAILLGYLIALLAIYSKQKAGKGNHLIALVIFLMLEMILAASFSAHKLYLLQSAFGLKDQRILASCGVLFVGFSFLLLFWKIFSPNPNFSGFRAQTFFLGALVVALNWINVDLFTTHTNPIRYYVDKKPYVDYSYLLSNSDDNFAEWPALMRRMKEENPPAPPHGYFWGFESKSGKDAFYIRYAPICSDRPEIRTVKEADGTTLHLPTAHVAFLFKKYGTLAPAEPAKNPVASPNNELDEEDIQPEEIHPSFDLSQALDFNWREYASYKSARANAKTFEEFSLYLDKYCEAPPGRM